MSARSILSAVCSFPCMPVDRLQACERIAGGDYSAANMATRPWAHYLERYGFDPDGYPALGAWCRRADARLVVRRARARQTEAFSAVVMRSRKSVTAEDFDRFFGRAPDVPAADYSAVVKM